MLTGHSVGDSWQVQVASRQATLQLGIFSRRCRGVGLAWTFRSVVFVIALLMSVQDVELVLLVVEEVL